MEFIRRTEKPKKTDKWFADHNPWLGGKSDMFKNNQGNCTNFSYCEISRLIGEQSKLPTFDAVCSKENSKAKNNVLTPMHRNWYENCPSNYTKGQEPKLGAVIVLQHKGKYRGHVGVVEEVKSNGDIVVCMSGYKSYLYKERTLTKASGYVYSDYKLLGFVYPPVEFTTTEVTTSTYTGTFPSLPSRGYFKKGDKGTQVKNLQKFLNWANNASLSIDGIIGSKTIAQVKTFQKSAGITSDGLFGKTSLAKAKEYTK